MIPDHMRKDDEPRPPSGGTAPVESPPGLIYIDAQCEAAARRDRAVALQQKLETEWIGGLLERKNPHMAKTAYDPLQRYDDEVHQSAYREKK
jgi:hypothetical protein